MENQTTIKEQVEAIEETIDTIEEYLHEIVARVRLIHMLDYEEKKNEKSNPPAGNES